MTAADPQSVSDLVPKTNSTVIPGYTLTELKARQLFAECRSEFEAKYLRLCLTATEGQGDAVSRRLLDHARDAINAGEFRWGRNGKESCPFDRAATDPANTPFLLWLELQEKHPGVSRRAAEKLINDKNFWSVYWAVIVLAGYQDLSQQSEKKSPDVKTPDQPTSENGIST